MFSFICWSFVLCCASCAMYFFCIKSPSCMPLSDLCANSLVVFVCLFVCLFVFPPRMSLEHQPKLGDFVCLFLCQYSQILYLLYWPLKLAFQHQRTREEPLITSMLISVKPLTWSPITSKLGGQDLMGGLFNGQSTGCKIVLREWSMSKWISVTGGVFQESVLGLMFFNIFINYINSRVQWNAIHKLEGWNVFQRHLVRLE